MCRLEKDPGPCPGSVLRWYYDAVRQMCSQFVYGGCKGNANRFLTRAACEQRCPVKGIRKSKKETIVKKKRKRKGKRIREKESDRIKRIAQKRENWEIKGTSLSASCITVPLAIFRKRVVSRSLIFVEWFNIG